MIRSSDRACIGFYGSHSEPALRITARRRIGASEGASGSAALGRAAPPHGPSPRSGSGPRRLPAIRYAKCQAVFQRLRSRASHRYARVRFHARDSFGKWAVSASWGLRELLPRPLMSSPLRAGSSTFLYNPSFITSRSRATFSRNAVSHRKACVWLYAHGCG